MDIASSWGGGVDISMATDKGNKPEGCTSHTFEWQLCYWFIS